MAETPHDGAVIISVQRTLRILETIGSCPHGATFEHITAQTGLPASTLGHHLRTLAHEGYIARGPDARWILGDRLDQLALPYAGHRDHGGRSGGHE